ncbi:MAG: phosphoglucosamine mutase [Flavobacteriales bacterium]|jgi:phosphomannomutase|nr:phosphoglucosamine mutase [Flavobacteriales bacterium]
MTLIKSVSGIRGTIHDCDSQGLCTKEIDQCISQFIAWVVSENKNINNIIIAVGRDGRTSGRRILDLIIKILIKKNIAVLNLGLTTTPSVQIAISSEKCFAGIMVSASHNPTNWNGLKLLNARGEFLNKQQSEEVFNYNLISNQLSNSSYKAEVNYLDFKEKHISSILNLVDVNVNMIRLKKYKIVVDGINSSGGVYVPYLLEKLGVQVVELNCSPNGIFAHNPEPLPVNLTELSSLVKVHKADLGIAVDPDVDRLVLVCEDGDYLGEENTIVTIVKYIINHYPGSVVVSNLSTTKAVSDVVLASGGIHYESAVGEINVVELMKEKKAIIGGEGSGGVIFSLSHYGRDALVGIALFLSFLAESNLSASAIKLSLPSYFMLKEKIEISLNKSLKFDILIEMLIMFSKKNNYKYSCIDGVKIYYLCGGWSHIRISNTEPIIRLIVEANAKQRALDIKKELINELNHYLK